MKDKGLKICEDLLKYKEGVVAGIKLMKKQFTISAVTEPVEV